MIPNNSCGERRNHRLHIRLTSDEESVLEKMAEENGKDVSGLVRGLLFKYNPLTAAKEEIQRAVGYVKKGYERVVDKVQNTIYPEDNYVPFSPAYASNPGYG